MKLIKHIFVLTLMVAFTFNATVGFATGMCSDDHHDSHITETPCHESETTELDHMSPDDSKQEQEKAKCTTCKCGHCKSHSKMSLGHNAVSPDVQFSQSSLSAHHKDTITSLIIYGIDNPPKHIS